MPPVLRIAAAWLAVAFGILPAHADLGPVIAHYGNWGVHRAVDQMTDKINCLATYKGNDRIQLANNAMYVKTVGTPRSYRYRLNDEPASRMITVAGVFQKIGAVELSGDLFNRLVRAQRLRLQVLTYRRFAKVELREFDFDLDGIYNAYAAVYHCH